MHIYKEHQDTEDNHKWACAASIDTGGVFDLAWYGAQTGRTNASDNMIAAACSDGNLKVLRYGGAKHAGAGWVPSNHD